MATQKMFVKTDSKNWRFHINTGITSPVVSVDANSGVPADKVTMSVSGQYVVGVFANDVVKNGRMLRGTITG